MIGKLLVFIAAGLGIFGFFQPLVVVTPQPGTQVAVSSFEIIKGVQQLRSQVDQGGAAAGTLAPSALPPGVTLGQPIPKDVTSSKLNELSGYLLIPWGPTALFLLFFLIGIGRFGRGLGVMSFVIGLVGVGGWFVLQSSFEQAVAGAQPVVPGLGFTLILVGAIVGGVGGLAAVAAPQT